MNVQVLSPHVMRAEGLQLDGKVDANVCNWVGAGRVC